MGPRPRAWLACAVGLTVGILVAAVPTLSCGSSRNAQAPAPASSSERAHARDERAARKKAFEEQGERVAATDAPPEDEPEDEPEDAPPAPSASASVDAEVGEPDAGAPSDAGADAASADAATLADQDICETLCKRAVDCALAAFEDGPQLPPELRRRMEETVRKEASRCTEHCHEEVSAKPERVTRAKECVDKPECDEFMTCIRDVVGEN